MRGHRSELWFVGACLAAMAGCVGAPTDGSGTPDAKPPPKDARPNGDGPLPLPDGPGEFRCRNRITVGLDNGHHNPGQNCQQGCHNHNFYMSGTLYTPGGQPIAGASITFIDANGETGDMVSGTNGNFWWGLFPVTFPVRIIASMCPDIAPMNTMVMQSSNGACNAGGACHSGSAGRIHLP